MSASNAQNTPSERAVFIDAAGTLIRVRNRVGETYAGIAQTHGLQIEPEVLEAAFRSSWKSLSQPQREGDPSLDDEKGWWLNLVDHCFRSALGDSLPPGVLRPLFDELYAHYALPESWLVFPDVVRALDLLRPHFRLYVLSNFDRRLRSILHGHDLTSYFDEIIISSEIGASKPHPLLFAAAARIANSEPENCIHIGDDLECDLKGARDAGFKAFHLDRKTGTLLDIARRIMPPHESEVERSVKTVIHHV
jgi:putative hydrolase of the HAD superfamily